jgi:two-component system, OmpR family, response regulator ResD
VVTAITGRVVRIVIANLAVATTLDAVDSVQSRGGARLGEPKPPIVVADDEPIVVEVVERYLRRDGFRVVTAATADEAWRAAIDGDTPPDAIILDVMLPGGDGIDLCRRLRNERGRTVPILLLTARGEEADRIAGLNVGADDYVVKPFSRSELVARVRANLRRVQLDTTPPHADATLRGGDVCIDPQNRSTTVSDVPVHLTAKEFDLLHFLMAHRGKAFGRDELLDAIWDRDYFGDQSTVTVHIRRLREKIERDPARPAHVKAVWGVGYKFDPSA